MGKLGRTRVMARAKPLLADSLAEPNLAMSTLSSMPEGPQKEGTQIDTGATQSKIISEVMALRHEHLTFQVGSSDVKPVESSQVQDQVQPEPPVKRARKARQAKTNAEAKAFEAGNEMREDVIEPVESKPKGRQSKAKAKKAKEEDTEQGEVNAVEEEPKTKSSRKGVKRKIVVPVYDIPPIAEGSFKTTTFTGKLGYACLNTCLRNLKPEPVFCSRTLRIDTIKKEGLQAAKECGRRNILDLQKVIQWNEDNNIKFFRISSEMFPFSSHGEYGYDLEYAAAELKAAGDLANKYGHRLTSHPGQFTQLGSPTPNVVKNAIADLKYHCEMLDRMGMGRDSVMIIHGGGVYNDKAAAMQRFEENWLLLPDNIKARLVLENDEICYNVDDLLPLCEKLGIPLVLDWHHDSLYPSSLPPIELLPRINRLWVNKGIKPKQHLSEPRPGAVNIMERRAHADRCNDLPQGLEKGPEGLGDGGHECDLMIEAKDKEQAVLWLYRLYQLHNVKYESLRPATPPHLMSMRTNGRKSNKRKGGSGSASEAEVSADEIDPELGVDQALKIEGVASMEEQVTNADQEIKEALHAGEDSNGVKEEDKMTKVKEEPISAKSKSKSRSKTSVKKGAQIKVRKTAVKAAAEDTEGPTEFAMHVDEALPNPDVQNTESIIAETTPHTNNSTNSMQIDTLPVQ